ncbi:MAG: hypothetical protein NVSMB63_02820 [Sediminibacterium sp.]
MERHTIVNKAYDSLSSLSVGNGSFAFTVDVTGLQSFPDAYQHGVPLGTESAWGWHSFTNEAGYIFDETLKEYDFNNRKAGYSVQWNEPQRNKDAANWFRQNVHRLQLGNIGFEIIKRNKELATINDIKNIHQELNMWTGEISSHFTLEDVPVDVSTYVNQDNDIVAVKIHSALLKTGRLQVRIRLPYPTGGFADGGNNWSEKTKHTTLLLQTSGHEAVIRHRLDSTSYFMLMNWTDSAILRQKEKHYFVLIPSGADTFEFNCLFSAKNNGQPVSYQLTKSNNSKAWFTFWTKGAAVDFAGSTDPRAGELERRIILSQYLTRIQCGGEMPPQETGLTYNSWYGKPHLEMHWWHGVHFALWNRLDMLEKQMRWYTKVAGEAQKIAKRQGYQGLRWQKMTDPDGKESPSSVGAFLIWQQPHFITFAELCYRQHANKTTLDQYKSLVFATADFMASYAYYDSAAKRYILGKGLIPAQERFKPEETFNPTYELAYWHWALTIAQKWRVRLGLARNKQWEEVLQKLSSLPKQNRLYLAAESAPDSYTNRAYKTDHPAVLGTYGMLPYSNRLDTSVMHRTFNWIWNNWDWKDTWGWDFPLTAMTATRLGLPDKAMDALFMPVKTNTYLSNGHNYQNERLRIYLPGNGGLLAAVALMCAGYDGCTTPNPGIPKNGQWKVKWEGLQKMF